MARPNLTQIDTPVGWIAQATIDRAVIISDADEILDADLPERLRQLQQRGWVEQRDSDAGADEPEWRLTGIGREVLPVRG
ncbi:MAG: hypothetical protein ACXVHX_37755 [Solirubrobacteraceae bacterium]